MRSWLGTLRASLRQRYQNAAKGNNGCTGERESVDPFDHIAEDAELGPDAIVDEEQAGISHDRPSPERNGAVDPRDGGDKA